MKKPKITVMTAMIDKGEVGIHETKNVLARVWRIILHQHGLSGVRWNKMLDGYHQRRNMRAGTKAKFLDKGNITSALVSDRLSWNTLMTGIDIMGFTSIKIVFHLGKRGVDLVIPITVLTDDLSESKEDDE